MADSPILTAAQVEEIRARLWKQQVNPDTLAHIGEPIVEITVRERDALVASLTAAREALAPFAEIANEHDASDEQRRRHYRDEGRPEPKHHPDGHRVSIELGECRAARAALGKENAPNGR